MLRHSIDGENEVIITPGGAEYNVACSLSLLGKQTTWVSSLPSTPEADMITKPAHQRGVNVTLVESPAKVGHYHIDSNLKIVRYERENSAFANLKSGDIDWRKTLSGTRWLVVSGITPLLSEGVKDNWSAAMTFAEIDGTLVALDLNHRPALGSFEELWGIIEPKLRQVHLLVVSTSTLANLTGGSGEENLKILQKKFNIPYLACTWKIEDERGQTRWSSVAHSHGLESTKTRPIQHTPIEPLGGGDAWLGGFLDGLLEGISLINCLRRGDILAALTQKTFGDLGDVRRTELERWESIEGESHLSVE